MRAKPTVVMFNKVYKEYKCPFDQNGVHICVRTSSIYAEIHDKDLLRFRRCRDIDFIEIKIATNPNIRAPNK
jgi:hypothetical protein